MDRKEEQWTKTHNLGIGKKFFDKKFQSKMAYKNFRVLHHKFYQFQCEDVETSTGPLNK
jgi:hypothetical protein